MTKTANDWVAEMLGVSQADVIPDGWISIDNMAKQTGLPVRTATNRAMKLIHEGKLERRQYKVKVAGRGLTPVWHYAPVTKRKK